VFRTFRRARQSGIRSSTACFCHITENWRGQPLVDRETALQLIGATRTTTGLRVKAKLDVRSSPNGNEVTDEELAEVNLVKEPFHGE